jgi:isopentenyl-diphosphate delta-isomerase
MEVKLTEIILVDENDNEIGIEEKLKVHKEGKLHRAFSIFIFNSKGELLLQKRAKAKYHSGGLWTNTCCSHPRPNQNIENEAKRRLEEEMGIDCDLEEISSIVYRTGVGNLIEHEFDHIFVGKFEGNPEPNKDEVEDWKWIGIDELKKSLYENPERYTSWFRIILQKIHIPIF